MLEVEYAHIFLCCRVEHSERVWDSWWRGLGRIVRLKNKGKKKISTRMQFVKSSRRSISLSLFSRCCRDEEDGRKAWKGEEDFSGSSFARLQRRIIVIFLFFFSMHFKEEWCKRNIFCVRLTRVAITFIGFPTLALSSPPSVFHLGVNRGSLSFIGYFCLCLFTSHEARSQ